MRHFQHSKVCPKSPSALPAPAARHHLLPGHDPEKQTPNWPWVLVDLSEPRCVPIPPSGTFLALCGGVAVRRTPHHPVRPLGNAFSFLLGFVFSFSNSAAGVKAQKKQVRAIMFRVWNILMLKYLESNSNW